jgi:glutaredoxin-like protein
LQPLLSHKVRQQVSSIFGEKLAGVPGNIQLINFIPAREDACEYCAHLKQLTMEIMDLSNGKIAVKNVTFEESKKLSERYAVRRAPATVITTTNSYSPSKDPAVKFYGFPGGHEFTALVEDVIDIANRHPSTLSDYAIEKIEKIVTGAHIQVFVTPTCPYCPRAVRVAHQLSIANPKMVDAEMIEALEFPELSKKYSVMAVPKIVINDIVEFQGALPESIFLSKVEEALSLGNVDVGKMDFGQ